MDVVSSGVVAISASAWEMGFPCVEGASETLACSSRLPRRPPLLAEEHTCELWVAAHDAPVRVVAAC